MAIIKTIVTVMNVTLLILILFFTRAMTWEKNKLSIIGFGYMIITIGMSSMLMWI